MEPITTMHYDLPKKRPRTALYVIVGILVLGIAAVVLFFAHKKQNQQPALEAQLQSLKEKSEPVTTTPAERAKELQGLQSKSTPATTDMEAQFQMLKSN